MTLRINKAHFPVTVLGYGRRIALWLQGCSIGCPGCCSRDTWDADETTHVPVRPLIEWCRTASGGVLDGVTISGGEPFEQPEGLLHLVRGLDAWRQTLGRSVDLLCYTGMPWLRVERSFPQILARLDAVIPEPFVRSLPGLPLRGSSNQTIVPLTPLGEARYCGSHMLDPAAPRMQVQVDRDRIWFIGIPALGDMERLEQKCRERGMTMTGASWRP
jgi:anaerobic ribonucleoside-triphosphate reductase activating protein